MSSDAPTSAGTPLAAATAMENISTPEVESTVIVVEDSQESSSSDRTCWICFESDEDSKHTEWVQPCQCNGSTKWVHHRCLHRWIDEKQKGNTMRSVSCQQCRTEYIIVFPEMAGLTKMLERLDNFVKRSCPFITAGIVVGAIYWSAVTYGAVTFLQIVGLSEGLAILSNSDWLFTLVGLPLIPSALIAFRFVPWQDTVIRIFRNRRQFVQKLPLLSSLFRNSCNPEADDEQTQNASTPQMFTDPVSATRILCGALALPTISIFFGRVLYASISSSIQRTVLGGLTFVAVKGILKIYLKQSRYMYRKQRRVVDYTPENIASYRPTTTSSRARQRSTMRDILAARAASISATRSVAQQPENSGSTHDAPSTSSTAAIVHPPPPSVHERDMVV